jgi:hypothetical protein
MHPKDESKQQKSLGQRVSRQLSASMVPQNPSLRTSWSVPLAQLAPNGQAWQVMFVIAVFEAFA